MKGQLWSGKKFGVLSSQERVRRVPGGWCLGCKRSAHVPWLLLFGGGGRLPCVHLDRATSAVALRGSVPSALPLPS